MAEWKRRHLPTGKRYRFLNKELVEAEEQPDLQAWMLHALSVYHSTAGLKRIDKFQSKAFGNLWKHKSRLNAYTRSLLALSAHHYGDKKRAMTLIENLENGVIFDKTPDTSIIQRGLKKSQKGVMATAHWGEDGIFYRWSNGGVEATAFALSALLAIDPKNNLVEPVMNWLIKNRRGANWSNTRDTAIVVLAMNQYLKTSGELKGIGSSPSSRARHSQTCGNTKAVSTPIPGPCWHCPRIITGTRSGPRR